MGYNATLQTKTNPSISYAMQTLINRNIWRWKIIVIMFSVIVAKQKSIARSLGGCKHKQSKV